MACRGVVTSRHDLASQVGLEVLARGGNASDADVATAFALPLLKRHECGVGGACPIMVFEPGRKATPDQPNPFVISGHGLHPGLLTIGRVHELGLRDTPGHWHDRGGGSLEVGAFITALVHVGRLGLADTLGPSVELARDGLRSTPRFGPRSHGSTVGSFVSQSRARRLIAVSGTGHQAPVA